MTIEEILKEVERRRKMFHWFVDGVIGGNGHLTPDNKVVYANRHGIPWSLYNRLTPDLVTAFYNVEL